MYPHSLVVTLQPLTRVPAGGGGQEVAGGLPTLHLIAGDVDIGEVVSRGQGHSCVSDYCIQ